jgi:protein arginine N-methyltransferase 1
MASKSVMGTPPPEVAAAIAIAEAKLDAMQISGGATKNGDLAQVEGATPSAEASPVPLHAQRDSAGKTLTSSEYYFDSYAHFGIHEEMLKDEVRTTTYQRAILQNKNLFKDKVVLDVGCGTGILCMFAAQAGAKKVFGIEMAGIVHSARKIVKANGFEDVITLLHGKAEDITLPAPYEKVDIIISEWMGYFLLYESMLDTVCYCRDKWLVKGGLMLPDKATLYMQAIEDGDYKSEKIDWWSNVYGFDMSCIQEDAMQEPLVDTVEARAVGTSRCPILDIDLYTVKLSDLDFSSKFTLDVNYNTYLHAFIAYFDVDFSASHTSVGFSTGPHARYTHWKQTVFYIDNELMASKDTKITGNIVVKRNAKNPRDLDIQIESEYESSQTGNITNKRMYHLR